MVEPRNLLGLGLTRLVAGIFKGKVTSSAGNSVVESIFGQIDKEQLT